MTTAKKSESNLMRELDVAMANEAELQKAFEDYSAPAVDISKTLDQAEASRTVMRGPGGAPCRATTLPSDAKQRKEFPVASGVLDYFPDALVAISNLSFRGNEQHNPGKPLQWDRAKSGDEADTMLRHFLQRGTLDADGVRHTAKMAWRALALLQKEIESENKI